MSSGINSPGRELLRYLYINPAVPSESVQQGSSEPVQQEPEVSREPVSKKQKTALLPSFQEVVYNNVTLPRLQAQQQQFQHNPTPYDPTFYGPNGLVAYAPPQAQPQPTFIFPNNQNEVTVTTTKVVETTEVVFKSQTDNSIKDQLDFRLNQQFRLELENFDLTPEGGWGEEKGTWQKKVNISDLEFCSTIKPDLKEKILKAMTFFDSPTGKSYVFINRKIKGISKELCSEKTNAHLNPKYKKIVFGTNEAREIEWIKYRVFDLCESFVPQEYEKAYPGRRNNNGSANSSINAAFACYVKIPEESGG